MDVDLVLFTVAFYNPNCWLLFYYEALVNAAVGAYMDWREALVSEP